MRLFRAQIAHEYGYERGAVSLVRERFFHIWYYMYSIFVASYVQS